MNTWEERMRPRSPAPLPQLELVATFFRVQGASKRPMRCCVYRVPTGVELRLEYEDREDLQRSQLFPVQDDEAISAMADNWRLKLLATGNFQELPTGAGSRRGVTL